MTSIAGIHIDYARASLDIADVDANPLCQFRHWLDEALRAEIAEVDAMTLATVDPHGQPSAHIALLKNLDERDFTFFTNYTSRKGGELIANPRAAPLLYWIGLKRQVRIQGIVKKVGDAESGAYYHSCPPSSCLGAWASEQSSEVPDRATPGAREAEYRQRFGDAPPHPPHWGGYQLLPERLEFQQGCPSRLYDWLEYRKHADGSWTIVRLASQPDGRCAIRYCASHHVGTALAAKGSVRHALVGPTQRNGKVCRKLK